MLVNDQVVFLQSVGVFIPLNSNFNKLLFVPDVCSALCPPFFSFSYVHICLAFVPRLFLQHWEHLPATNAEPFSDLSQHPTTQVNILMSGGLLLWNTARGLGQHKEEWGECSHEANGLAPPSAQDACSATLSPASLQQRQRQSWPEKNKQGMRSQSSVLVFNAPIIGTLRSHNATATKTSKQQFCKCIAFFCTFHRRFRTTTTWKCQI